MRARILARPRVADAARPPRLTAPRAAAILGRADRQDRRRRWRAGHSPDRRRAAGAGRQRRAAAMNEFLGLEGKVAVVTGGASGLGEAVARGLVREGARVVLGDVDVAGLERVAKELGD